MRRRRRFGGFTPLKTDVALQITSMADIFTILLVFLLKSFSTGVTNIAPSHNMTLPMAKRADPPAEMLKVEISSDSVVIDDRSILKLQDFKLDPKDLDAEGNPTALKDALVKEREKDTLQKTPKVMLLADQGTPYSTVKAVLSSASMAGYQDFKLVAVEEQ